MEFFLVLGYLKRVLGVLRVKFRGIMVIVLLFIIVLLLFLGQFGFVDIWEKFQVVMVVGIVLGVVVMFFFVMIFFVIFKRLVIGYSFLLLYQIMYFK